MRLEPLILHTGILMTFYLSIIILDLQPIKSLGATTEHTLRAVIRFVNIKNYPADDWTVKGKCYILVFLLSKTLK
jgi:hypothetical protein